MIARIVHAIRSARLNLTDEKQAQADLARLDADPGCHLVSSKISIFANPLQFFLERHVFHLFASDHALGPSKKTKNLLYDSLTWRFYSTILYFSDAKIHTIKNTNRSRSSGQAAKEDERLWSDQAVSGQALR
jgi:hypothetical protein